MHENVAEECLALSSKDGRRRKRTEKSERTRATERGGEKETILPRVRSTVTDVFPLCTRISDLWLEVSARVLCLSLAPRLPLLPRSSLILSSIHRFIRADALTFSCTSSLSKSESGHVGDAASMRLYIPLCSPGLRVPFPARAALRQRNPVGQRRNHDDDDDDRERVESINEG